MSTHACQESTYTHDNSNIILNSLHDNDPNCPTTVRAIIYLYNEIIYTKMSILFLC